MSLTPNNVSYHDLTSLQNIRSESKSDEPAALRKAAEQFEAIFVGMLLTSMRKANAAFEADGMMNSQTTKFYRDMHDSQLATDLAQSGSLGLADLMVQQLSPAAYKKHKTDQAMPLHQEKALQMPSSTHKTLKMPKHILPTLPIALHQPVASQVTDNNVAAVAVQSPEQTTTANTTSAMKDWQVSSPEQFVRTLLPAARQTAKALGLDPMALIAQAALETGWGQRMIKTAQGGHSFNLFGIKANNGWQGETAVVDTLEYRQGIAKKEQAKFRSYDSPQQSMQDYVEFIQSSPRYQDAVKASADPKAYFEQLQASGYATDPAYAQKIMAVYHSPTMKSVRSEQNETQEPVVAAD